MIICRVYSIPQVSTLYLHPSFSDVTNNASHNFCEAILIHAIFKQTRRSQYASGKHKEQRISGIPCSTVGNYFMTMGGSQLPLATYCNLFEKKVNLKHFISALGYGRLDDTYAKASIQLNLCRITQSDLEGTKFPNSLLFFACK